MNWRILKIIKIVALCIALVCLVSFLVMNLWNWLMPEIFGLKMITFTQAFGLLILSKIFFSGLKGGPSQQTKERWKGQLRKRWEKKLENLSPEEREKIKEECKKRWSGWCDSEEEKPATHS